MRNIGLVTAYSLEEFSTLLSNVLRHDNLGHTFCFDTISDINNESINQPEPEPVYDEDFCV